VRGGETRPLASHGGREEERLARLRQTLEDLGELGLEAHVEHPVGLVEHQDLDVVEPGRPLLEVIDQPPGVAMITSRRSLKAWVWGTCPRRR